MEVILLEKISKLGDLGEKLRVKPGFGRNFLIPMGKALPATKQNVALFEARRTELEKIQAERLVEARVRAEALEGLLVTVSALAGEEGRLFGSVGEHEIIKAVGDLGHLLSKQEVRLAAGPLRQARRCPMSQWPRRLAECVQPRARSLREMARTGEMSRAVRAGTAPCAAPGTRELTAEKCHRAPAGQFASAQARPTTTALRCDEP